jgi:type IV fimbrial biogenesis protein FimT
VFVNARTARAGFTLIELAVALMILTLLIVLATPSYRTWIANSRVRSTSESIQNGLRLARNQAVDRAQRVRFELPTDATANWMVCVPATASGACDGLSALCDTTRTGCLLQQFVDASAVRAVTLATSPGSGGSLAAPLSGFGVRGVTFDPFGRADTGTTALGRVDVYSTIEGTRRLIDLISANGSVRQCDANLRGSADTPEGCA